MNLYSFQYSEEDLLQIATDLVGRARALGADQVAASVSEAFELSIGARAGHQESCEFGQDCEMGLIVYVGKRTGQASCGSLNSQDMDHAIERALVIARNAEEDDCAGLPEPATLADGRGPTNLDLHRPWRPALDEVLRLAIETEAAALAFDQRISRPKSEGAMVGTTESRAAFANSLGFATAQSFSIHTIGCSAIAEVQGGLETAGWDSCKRASEDLQAPSEIGTIAARRACARDGARSIANTRLPVIFESGVAHSLIGNLLGAISGGNLYRKLSYLRDAVGQQVCAPELSIREDPFVHRGKRSKHCDSEGVRVGPRLIVEAGILQGYLLSSYSGRKLKLASTGNAGGAHNINLEGPQVPYRDLFKRLDNGLFITAMMGQGVNLVTGNYSRGAEGFRIINGEIAYPVRELTVAGTLPDILVGIRAIGDDVREIGGIECGSLLCDELAIGGRQ